MATSLIIESTDSNGKAVSKAYPCMKETATDAELRDFGTKLNAFSDHTLDNIYRVDKKDITKDDAPVDPNFTISPTTCKITALSPEPGVTISLSYDGPKRKPTLSGKQCRNTLLNVAENSIEYYFGGDPVVETGTASGTMTITLPAVDGYAEATATFTVTGATDNAFDDI